MKKMFITLALAAVAATSAFAQISVGAGYVSNPFTSSYTSGSTTTTEKNSNSGIYVGADYTLPVGPIAVTAGAKFVSLGRHSENTILGVTTKSKTSESYIAVPVAANYSYEINKDLTVFAFAGPTLAVGLSSNTHVEIGDSTKTDTDNYGDDSKYNKANLFVGAGLGVDVMDMIRVKVGYDLGLLNRTTAENCKLTENQIYFGVAYLF